VTEAREPEHRLPSAARAYWRVETAGRGAVMLFLALAFGPAVQEIGIPGWVPAAVVLAISAVATAVVPDVRWRRWRYEVREEEVDLRHGLFTVRRTLVPIRRVQHVDTESGPLQSSMDLATVSLHTAAGRTEIPALRRGDAEDVRRRVGELARTRDDT
jgi:uncharacterized protein